MKVTCDDDDVYCCCCGVMGDVMSRCDVMMYIVVVVMLWVT